MAGICQGKWTFLRSKDETEEDRFSDVIFVTYEYRLSADQFFQYAFVTYSERGSLQHRDLALAEVRQYASDGLARGADNLGNLFVSERQFHLGLGLFGTGGGPLKQ